MRHFIFEFITGGGLSGQDLPDSILNEGEQMLQMLIRELTQLDDTELTFTRDARLDSHEGKYQQCTIDSDLDKKLPQLLKNSDVCWLIAPETNARLEKYTALFNDTITIRCVQNM